MDGRVCFPYDVKALDPSEYTMAEMFKDAGYVTGCFGKWHLGHKPGFLPQDHGFDVYEGIPYSNDMWPPLTKACNLPFPPLPWIVGQEPVAIRERGLFVRQISKNSVLQERLCIIW
ncbi:MAG: sulfatase-like hydrolase/transferase [Planctomycetota bacterium]|jgi:hypothetical protein